MNTKGGTKPLRHKRAAGDVRACQKKDFRFFDCFYVMPPLTNGEHYKYRIIRMLKTEHKLNEDDAVALAEQILKSRHANPKLQEQKLFLLFNGRYLMSSDGKLLLDAVSGKPVIDNKIKLQDAKSGAVSKLTQKEFNYSYKRQGEIGEGGIPQGLYSIKAKEQRSFRTSPLSHGLRAAAWGDYSWALHPDKNTDMRSRKNFFIHGGTDFGSAGCIDLQRNDMKFQKYFESTGASFLYVYVSYESEYITIQQKE